MHVNLRAQLYVEYVNVAWFILLGGSYMDVGAVHNHFAVEGRINLFMYVLIYLCVYPERLTFNSFQGQSPWSKTGATN